MTMGNFHNCRTSAKNEKFDDYLGKHGIGFISRKLVNKVPCTVEVIENEDGTWTVNEITAVRTASSTFTLGERWKGDEDETGELGDRYMKDWNFKIDSIRNCDMIWTDSERFKSPSGHDLIEKYLQPLWLTVDMNLFWFYHKSSMRWFSYILAFLIGRFPIILFRAHRHKAIHPVTQNEIFAVVVIEDGKQVSKCFAGEDSDDVLEWSTRELLPDGTMFQVIYFGDLVCRRWFVKLEEWED